MPQGGGKLEEASLGRATRDADRDAGEDKLQGCFEESRIGLRQGSRAYVERKAGLLRLFQGHAQQLFLPQGLEAVQRARRPLAAPEIARAPEGAARYPLTLLRTLANP